MITPYSYSPKALANFSHRECSQKSPSATAAVLCSREIRKRLVPTTQSWTTHWESPLGCRPSPGQSAPPPPYESAVGPVAVLVTNFLLFESWGRGRTWRRGFALVDGRDSLRQNLLVAALVSRWRTAPGLKSCLWLASQGQGHGQRHGVALLLNSRLLVPR